MATVLRISEPASPFPNERPPNEHPLTHADVVAKSNLAADDMASSISEAQAELIRLVPRNSRLWILETC